MTQILTTNPNPNPNPKSDLDPDPYPNQVPEQLDAPRVRRAMLELFPSYRSRFEAIDKMQRIMEGCELRATPHDGPCLLLLSTETHPVFDSLAGGKPAEARTLYTYGGRAIHMWLTSCSGGRAVVLDAQVKPLCSDAHEHGV